MNLWPSTLAQLAGRAGEVRREGGGRRRVKGEGEERREERERRERRANTWAPLSCVIHVSETTFQTFQNSQIVKYEQFS